MKKFFKEIWSKYPNWIKWLAGGVLLFSLFDKIITSIRDGEPLVISEGWLYLFLAAILLIVIGFIISVFKIAYKYFSKSELLPTPIYASPKKLKMLPQYIDLFVESDSSLEFTVKSVRCFHPDDNPGVERFLKAITIKPILCSKCKNELAEVFSDLHREIVFSCPQFDCENHLKIKLTRSRYKLVIEQFIYQLTSEIRKNFPQYWQIYKDKYKNLTNGNYDDYYEPLSYSNLNYYL